jgi:hypothetical protein
MVRIGRAVDGKSRGRPLFVTRPTRDNPTSTAESTH